MGHKRAQIETDCPFCGPVRVNPRVIRCGRVAGSSLGICEVCCPICSRLIVTPLSAAGIDTLVELGAHEVDRGVALEFLERPGGAPVSWDDFLDFHAELDRHCCVPDELAPQSFTEW